MIRPSHHFAQKETQLNNLHHVQKPDHGRAEVPAESVKACLYMWVINLPCKNFMRQVSHVEESSFQGNDSNFALLHHINAGETSPPAAPRLNSWVFSYLRVVDRLQTERSEYMGLTFWLPGQAASPQTSYVISLCCHFLVHKIGKTHSRHPEMSLSITTGQCMPWTPQLCSAHSSIPNT